MATLRSTLPLPLALVASVGPLAWSCAPPAPAGDPSRTVASAALAPLTAPTATDPASEHVCTEIVGLDNIALTFDGGRTLVRSGHRVGKVTSKVVSLGAPYTLAAIGGGEVFVSVDGGCHWASRAPASAYDLGEGQAGLAFAWNANDAFAINVEGSRTVTLPAGPAFVAPDVVTRGRVTALGSEGGVFDSRDEGGTWQKVGNVDRVDAHLIVALAPGDSDHMLVADTRGSPVELTRDGGRTWTASTGTAHPTGLYFERDAHVAWSFGTELDRSVDGGASFTRVATPVPSGHGDLVLAGAQADPDALVFVGSDTKLHTRFILRFDPRSFQSTQQMLPIDAGHSLTDSESASDVVTSATFVPGEASALCLEITRQNAYRRPY